MVRFNVGDYFCARFIFYPKYEVTYIAVGNNEYLDIVLLDYCTNNLQHQNAS